MRNIRGLLAISATLSMGGYGFLVSSTAHLASAETVTTAACSADVSPSTGVSVRVASNGDCVVKFTSSSTVTWTRPTNIFTYEILVVGGGGGGGAHHDENPGGGGGGGVIHVPEISLNEASYQIQVGRGGIGNDAVPPKCAQHPWYAGESGRHSYFGATLNSPLITAFGGGGGGGACEIGFAGGSGGGNHCTGGARASDPGRVSSSITGARLYGNEGGSANTCRTGSGGGGGASTPGENGTATKAGDGGEGIALDVLGTGTPIVYASGGGSAPGADATTVGLGGTNGGDAKVGDGPTGDEHQGVDETGSGGGAQRCPTRPMVVPCPAGAGGDGVVIIRYSLSSVVTPAPSDNSQQNQTQSEATPQINSTTESVQEVAPEVAQVPTRRINKNTKTTPQTSAKKNVITATTVPSPTTTAAVKPVAPQAPETNPGEAKLLVDGEAAEMEISRRDNQLFVTNGSLSSALSAITPQGERRALDEAGNIRFEEGDSLELLATGFAGDTDLEVWVFSTPRDLGLIRTSTRGEAESRLTVPTDIEHGNHKVVISGTSRSGAKVVVAVGIIIGARSGGVSTAQKFFIALPITAAVIAGLIIPTRRRRKADVA